MCAGVGQPRRAGIPPSGASGAALPPAPTRLDSGPTLQPQWAGIARRAAPLGRCHVEVAEYREHELEAAAPPAQSRRRRSPRSARVGARAGASQAWAGLAGARGRPRRPRDQIQPHPMIALRGMCSPRRQPWAWAARPAGRSTRSCAESRPLLRGITAAPARNHGPGGPSAARRGPGQCSRRGRREVVRMQPPMAAGRRERLASRGRARSAHPGGRGAIIPAMLPRRPRAGLWGGLRPGMAPRTHPPQSDAAP